MDDFIDFCQHRRSVRDFSTKTVAFEDVVDCLHAATYAPSVSDLQPWEFVVVTSGSAREAVVSCCKDSGWLLDAPVLVAVLLDRSRFEAYHGSEEVVFARDSCVAAAMNVVYAALSKGLGSCWVTDFFSEKLAGTLKIPASCEIVCLLALGYPAEADVIPKHVTSLNEITYFDVYGAKRTDVSTYTMDYGAAAREVASEAAFRVKKKPFVKRFRDQLDAMMGKKKE
ncbi:MAG: nitroreductase family protein [Candidatus Woesearchaeota archaeon]